MNSLLVKRGNIYLEVAAFIIILVLCTVIPFICFPKIVLHELTRDAIDFFTYYKSIAQYILAALALLILFAFGTINYKSHKIKLKITLLLFTVWVAVSTYFSAEQDTSIWGYTLQYKGLLSYISYFVFYILVLNTFNNKALKMFIHIVLASSSLMAFLCLSELYDIQILETIFSNKYTFSTQIHTTVGNSNSVGGYFSLMAPLSLMMFLRSKEKAENILLLFSTMACFEGLIFSFSRISWISVLFSCVLCLLLVRRSGFCYKRIIVLLVLVVAVTFVVDLTRGSIINEKLTNMTNQVKGLATTDIRHFGSNRIYAYEKFIKLTLKSPKNALVGVGPNCLYLYGWTSDKDAINNPELAKVIFVDAHSDLIEFAVSMGIPALILYICFIASILLPWINKIKSASPEMTGIFAAWLGYLIQSLFNITSVGIIGTFIVFSALLDRKDRETV